MSRNQRAKVIRLGREVNRTQLHPCMKGKEIYEMTIEEKREALRCIRKARGFDPDIGDPEMNARLASMTTAEKMDLLQEIRAQRFALSRR